MDKLSAVLISAICLMLCVSAAVVYSTWFADDDKAVYAATLKQVEEEMLLADIAMNNDAQVINGGGQDMWIRAKVEMPDEGTVSSDNGINVKSYELVSDSISEHPLQGDIKKGVWVPDHDGYYYYSQPVRPGEQSRSLFQWVYTREKSGALDGSSIKVQAEAIQVNWISKKVKTCREAFRIFGMFQPLEGGTLI